MAERIALAALNSDATRSTKSKVGERRKELLRLDTVVVEHVQGE